MVKQHVNWSKRTSLDNFLRNEKKYKIQLVSFEDIKIFLQYLDHLCLKYDVCDNDTKNKIIVSTSADSCRFHKRAILYNNTFVHGFIQISFSLTYEEKLSFLNVKLDDARKNTFVIDTNKTKPLHELYRLQKSSYEESDNIQYSFDYMETLIIFSLIRYNKLQDIARNIVSINADISNSFSIQTKLNGLVYKRIVACRNGAYKLIIPYDVVQTICSKVDLDVKRIEK